MRTRGIVLAAVLGAFLAAPALAQADFHLIKIREVFGGGPSQPQLGPSFVELQAYASGQTNLAGHTLTVHAADGEVTHTFTFPAPGPLLNPASQRRILISGDSALPADYVDPGLGFALEAAGAVCFEEGVEAVDCVAWGGDGFTGAASLPSPAGTPVADSGLGASVSLNRSIAAGCETLLEPSDDTNDSAADFSTGAPTRQTNADTPTEQACPAPPVTTITKKPPRRTTKRRARFAFTSSINPATFACSIDARPFTACESPLRTPRLKPGRHRFRVRATANGLTDPTPAVHRWRIVRG